MTYILLDELGDLGFSFDKGSSRYFVMAVIITDDIRRLEKIARNIHKGLKKRRGVHVLHASEDSDASRVRLLKKVAGTDCKISAIICDKHAIKKGSIEKKPIMYRKIADLLLERLFKDVIKVTSDPVTLIASRCESNKYLNEIFKSFLADELKKKLGVEINIEIATPGKEKSLQVVDHVSWAMYRKYEFGDFSYYKLIESKILGEYAFKVRTTTPHPFVGTALR